MLEINGVVCKLEKLWSWVRLISQEIHLVIEMWSSISVLVSRDVLVLGQKSEISFRSDAESC